MSVTHRPARPFYVVLCVLVVLVLAAVGRGAFFGSWPFGARIDPQTGTAAFSVETDRGTGCQYVVTPWGGIMPRTGSDGRQLCPSRAP